MLFKNTLILLLICFSLESSEPSNPEKSDELTTIETLIASTKRSLVLQESIRNDLIEYQKVNQSFLKKPNDNELLFQNLKLADLLFTKIKNAHLTENFNIDFIKELTLFSDIAAKSGVSKP